MHKPLAIVLLDSLEDRALEDVITLVREKLGTEVGVLGKITCLSGFDRGRGQWNANLLVSQCIREFSSQSRFCVGLTGADLYVPRLNFVFGLALRREGLAIVSWHRLRGEGGVLVARLAKEMIHEIGHLEGLEHCNNRSCVMWFSNTLRETDSKGPDFCTECKGKREVALFTRGSP